ADNELVRLRPAALNREARQALRRIGQRRRRAGTGRALRHIPDPDDADVLPGLVATLSAPGDKHSRFAGALWGECQSVHHAFVSPERANGPGGGLEDPDGTLVLAHLRRPLALVLDGPAVAGARAAANGAAAGHRQQGTVGRQRNRVHDAEDA